MKTPPFSLLCFSAILVSSVCMAQSTNPLDLLSPGEWYQVPNSHMRSVNPCPDQDCSYSGSSFQALMNSWSGGAYDTERDRLIVWGGGHGDYGGNEVYVFDINTLQWSRVNEPSDPPAVDEAYASDGGPCSRHTYNYIQYVPAIDRFCSFGGAAFFTTGQTGTNNTDCFNFDNNTWENKGAMPACGYLIGSISAVDHISGKVWTHGTGDGWLLEWDPVNNTWTPHGQIWESENVDYYRTAAINPDLKQMVAIGNGFVTAWDLTGTGTISYVSKTTTGATNMVSENSPGFEFDPAIGKFVAWDGGANVYILDDETWEWTEITPAASNTVIPTSANSNGTFGRFRYIPSKDLFIAVNSVDEDVYVYRLPSGLTSSREKSIENNIATISSNPNDGRFEASFHAITPDLYTIEISNNVGEIFYSEVLDNFSGNYTKQFDLSQYGAALYVMTIRSSKNQVVKKISVY